MRIYKDFKFEAAHFLPSAPAGTANARVHGHSFRARVVIEGEPDSASGYVFHLMICRQRSAIPRMPWTIDC